MPGNEIVMYEGYGASRKRSRTRASGKQTAARKRFGHCAKSCRKGSLDPYNAPGSKNYGSCMRSCLRSKSRR